MPAKLKGVDKLLKDLKKLGKKGKQVIEFVTEENASEIELNAKTTASRIAFDKGDLAANILAKPVKELVWKVQANAFGTAPYSAYVEFGTGGLVDVPEEMKDVAILFKGAGIREVNLPARAYLYPSFVKQNKQYIKDLSNELDDLTDKI